jgi:hypothetical protein
MSYKYAGKDFKRPTHFIPASEDEARAKFAYFRAAEAKINGGPEPIEYRSGCGSDAGYFKHRSLKEDQCQPCKDGHAAAEAKRYWARRAQMANSTRS